MSKTTILIIGLVIGLGLPFAVDLALFGDSTPVEAQPLVQVHNGYNHIRIFEDGSYIAETRDGQPEQGCINGGLCND